MCYTQDAVTGDALTLLIVVVSVRKFVSLLSYSCTFGCRRDIKKLVNATDRKFIYFIFTIKHYTFRHTSVIISTEYMDGIQLHCQKIYLA